jgi:hypothetical protein
MYKFWGIRELKVLRFDEAKRHSSTIPIPLTLLER